MPETYEHYRARQFLEFDEEQINRLGGVKQIINLTFDDGEVILTTMKKTLLSSMYWTLHKEFPELRLLSKHHIRDKRFSNKVHSELLIGPLMDSIDNGICKNYDEGQRLTYASINKVFNFSNLHCNRYCTTLQIKDYVQIMDHPQVVQARSELVASHASIRNLYDSIKEAMADDVYFEGTGNNIREALLGDVTRIDGIIDQSVGCTGYRTDYDSYVQRIPNLKGYIEGFTKLDELLRSSRGSTKAFASQVDDLQQTEFTARRMQLCMAKIQKMLPIDCGSTDYINYQATSKSLPSIVGVNMYDEEIGTIRPIKEEDFDSIRGKVIKIRSPLRCKFRDKLTPCAGCMGDIAKSLPTMQTHNFDANLGHTSCVSTFSGLSQEVLSAKHHLASSIGQILAIPAMDKPYITLSKDDPSLVKLSRDLKGTNPTIIVPASAVKHMADINVVDSIKILDTSTLATMRAIVFERDHKALGKNTRRYQHPVSVTVGKQMANFSHDFLEYAKIHGWSLTPHGDYCFDLKKWNYAKPILKIPQQHKSPREFLSQVCDYIEKQTKPNKVQSVDRLTDAGDALSEFSSLIYERLSVNLSHLGVILLACLARSPERGDLRPPPLGDPEYFVTTRTAILRGDLSAALALGWHLTIFSDPRSYNIRNRPPHPFVGLYNK